MLNPLLSIIIPTFNAESTIERAIDSICSQRYQNWEIWIVDGDSSDNTISAVKTYATVDQRVRYISKPDKGIYDAMNAGIQLATGDWLYFLGSDDRLYSGDIIEKIFSNERVRESDILYGNVFSNEKAIHGKFDAAKLVRMPVPHQAMFFRKTVFERLGGYNVSCQCRADYLKTIELFFDKSIRWKYVNETIAYYARGGHSDTVYDTEFDRILESTFLKYFSDSLDQRQIYRGMLYAVPYNLKKGSLIKALRFIWNSGKTVEYIPHIIHGLKQRFFFHENTHCVRRF